MKLKEYILLILIGSAIAWSAWFIVLICIDPTTAGTLALILFYLTLFIALSGTLSTLQTLFRRLRDKDRSTHDIITTSLRQGIFLALIFECALWMLSQEYLNWLTTILLLVAVGLIEFLFISRSRRPQP